MSAACPHQVNADRTDQQAMRIGPAGNPSARHQSCCVRKHSQTYSRYEESACARPAPRTIACRAVGRNTGTKNCRRNGGLFVGADSPRTLMRGPKGYSHNRQICQAKTISGSLQPVKIKRHHYPINTYVFRSLCIPVPTRSNPSLRPHSSNCVSASRLANKSTELYIGR
jgi:hypothetical protein